MKIKKQLSRKQLRKQKKSQKKQRIQKYHQRKSFKSSLPQTHTIQSKSFISHAPKKNSFNQQHPKQSQQKIVKKKQIHKQEEFDSEDQKIEMYQKKLGIKGDNKKYGKLAKNMGFDGDLFSFLDNISKKVNKNKEDYQHQQNNQGYQDEFNQNQDQLQYDEDDQNIQQQMEQQYDNSIPEQDFSMEQQSPIKQQPRKLKNKQTKLTKQKTKKQNIIAQQPKQKNLKQNNKVVKISQPQVNKQNNQSQIIPNTNKPIQNIQVHKKMNSLFNKLSDGNLLITFRQFVNIFQSNPKSITITTFANLFIKFNLLIQKPLTHVMSANVVIAVSLHRVYGDKLMAQILYQLTQGYIKLQKQQQNLQQIEEIGYSRLFEKKKNFITLISFFYQFGSISSNFAQSVVSYLTKNIINKQNIELIYQIVQKCGVRMRNHDPGTLKQVIQILRSLIQESKKNGTFQTTKIKFIQIQINQIRFNKKGLFNADQRMGFLHTFLNKTIKQQAPAQERTIDVTFDQFNQSQDTSRPDWWLSTNNQQNTLDQQNNQPKYKINELSQQVKQLYELAKSMHFVTEIKKNIFVQLMSSHDYIQATKRLLNLKIKRLQDIATVLVEITLQQNAFNPFYVLVACKIAEQIPKFRVCLQFAIWDRIKQVRTFEARKISNLAKFTAWLISSQQANSSLTILKYFPDLLNVRSEQDIYLSILFKQLLKKSNRNWIIKLSHKLKQQKNKITRDGIRDYLGQILPNLQQDKQKQNATLLRKLLAVQFQAQIQND